MLDALKRLFSSTEDETRDIQETVVLSDFGSLRLNLSNPRVIKRLIATYDSTIDHDLVEAQMALRHSEKPEVTFKCNFETPVSSESTYSQEHAR